MGLSLFWIIFLYYKGAKIFNWKSKTRSMQYARTGRRKKKTKVIFFPSSLISPLFQLLNSPLCLSSCLTVWLPKKCRKGKEQIFNFTSLSFPFLKLPRYNNFAYFIIIIYLFLNKTTYWTLYKESYSKH
jgi:hypothetical protein